MENGCQQCCLVLKLGTEVSSMSDDMREVLAAGVREWLDVYEKLIREGQAKKVMRTDLDPAAAATLLLDYWMGALQRMLIERNVSPLRTAAAFLRQFLAA
jgi:TetR/AcrR family transcriptional repressor of nem operon